MFALHAGDAITSNDNNNNTEQREPPIVVLYTYTSIFSNGLYLWNVDSVMRRLIAYYTIDWQPSCLFIYEAGAELGAEYTYQTSLIGRLGYCGSHQTYNTCITVVLQVLVNAK